MRWVLLLWLTALPALACLWSYETDLNGHSVTLEDGAPERYLADLQREFGSEFWEAELAKARATSPATVETRNDSAVALMRLGRSKDALPILQTLEKEASNRYPSAANLGTCYELLGQDVNALNWIQEGVARNPDSHHGSEWLHGSGPWDSS